MDKNVRAGVLLSGGLDSLLAIKLMQEQDVEIFALFFKLPFSKDLEKELLEFSKKQKISLIVFDCTRGELFSEYLETIKKGKHGRGAGFNPCIDCKIFIFKKAKDFLEKNKLDFIVTGEVLDERPMSQKKKLLKLIEEESGLNGKVLRPLSAKLLEETFAEKEGLVNRENFFDIRGRRRVKQMELAKKFGLSYPTPAGGCLLCEKGMKKRFKIFFMMEKFWEHFALMAVGRHFLTGENWVIIGRNERENEILESVKDGFIVTPDYLGPNALILGEVDNSIRRLVDKMIRAYSKKGSLEERKVFEKYKF